MSNTEVVLQVVDQNNTWREAFVLYGISVVLLSHICCGSNGP